MKFRYDIDKCHFLVKKLSTTILPLYPPDVWGKGYRYDILQGISLPLKSLIFDDNRFLGGKMDDLVVTCYLDALDEDFAVYVNSSIDFSVSIPRTVYDEHGRKPFVHVVLKEDVE